jgi:uncharacterized membrane protein
MKYYREWATILVFLLPAFMVVGLYDTTPTWLFKPVMYFIGMSILYAAFVFLMMVGVSSLEKLRRKLDEDSGESK